MIQEQVLNRIILTNDISFITENNLDASYFSSFDVEFAYIKQHISQYNTVPDMPTFLNKFPNFPVINVTEPNTYLLQELVKDRKTGLLANVFNKARESLMNGDPETAQAALKATLEQLECTTTLNCVDILHDHSRFDSYAEKIDNINNYFITTGFPELDNILGGWDRNEELATIVARLGIGKSWLLLKCATAAAQAGWNVGIYSGEMSVNKVGYRIDTLFGHVSNGALVHGGGSVKNQYKAVLAEEDKMDNHIYVLTPSDIGGPATVSTLRGFVEKYKLDILFIDQHSLLEDERKGKTPTEKAANISRDLKILQTIKHMPIISVSQQNRDKTENDKDGNRTFDSSQVAMSDRIGQDSTVMIFIERKDDLFRLHLIKSRDTGDGRVLSYRTSLNDGTFVYVPDGNSTPEEIQQSGYSEDEVF